MAETREHRTRMWVAFLAGAVTMLVVVLLWLAWNATQSAVSTTLRADVLRRPGLPLPTTPPPEGPRLPQPPVPTPR